MSKVSLKDPDVLTNHVLMLEVQKIKSKGRKSKNAAKIVYDSINDFYFDDENGILIKKEDGYESYTFKIYRDSTNLNSKLENVIFSKNETGGFDSYLVKYPFTEQQLLLNSSENLQTSGAEFTVLSKATDYMCIGYIVYSGCSETHSNTVTCSNSEVSYDCYSSGGGGGPTGGGGSTGGGAQTGTNGQVITTPVGGGATSATAANPCKKIKKQLDKYTSLKQALVTLDATKNQNHENGIFIDSSNDNPQNLPAAGSASTVGASVGLPPPISPTKYVIIAHTHDASGPDGTGTYSIFSWGDLGAIANLIKNNQIDNDNFIFYLMTADGTSYALTIDWASNFADFFDINTNPLDLSQTNYYNAQKAIELSNIENTYYNEKTSFGKITLTSNPQDDLKIFLKMMKVLKLDVSLFKVDPTFTTYTKQTLSSNGTVVSGVPCN